MMNPFEDRGENRGLAGRRMSAHLTADDDTRHSRNGWPLRRFPSPPEQQWPMPPSNGVAQRERRKHFIGPLKVISKHKAPHLQEKGANP